MDVKDVEKEHSAPRVKVRHLDGKKSPGRQRSLKSLSSSPETTTSGEERKSVNLEIRTLTKFQDSSQVRDRVNKLIEVVNFAHDATTAIEELVKSINGIVDQASAKTTDARKLAILEEEANELVGEIRKRASFATSSGVRPLAGDRVDFKADTQFKKSVKIAYPEGAADAFGIGDVRLANKDSVPEVRKDVVEAQRRLESLRRAVDESREQVSSAVDAIDIALQNSEASEASIRDVDIALDLLDQMVLGIEKDPDVAKSAAGRLDIKSLNLLEL